jgi:hypothetical protein
MKFSHWLLLIGLGVSLAAPCGAQTNVCPNTISVHQDLAQSIPGWQVFPDDAPVQLAGVTFYDGPPTERASLVYNQEIRRAGKLVTTWHFAPERDRQIWMGCSYSGTVITVARGLSNEIKECSVSYDPQVQIDGSAQILKIDCR